MLTVPVPRRPRVLISFHYYGKRDLAELFGPPGTVELFADSGAFSAFNSGAQIDVADYAAWLKTWRDWFCIGANLDDIGSYQVGLRNLRYLEKADVGVPLLPVFHPNEPWDVLDGLCKDYDYLAIGGIASAKRDTAAARMRWAVKSTARAAELGTKVHGFGVTAATMLLKLPCYSVDSTTYTYCLRGVQMFMWDHRAKRVVSPAYRNRRELQANAYLLSSLGLRPARMLQPGFMRAGDPAKYRQEQTWLLKACARSYVRMGQHLAARHQVEPPPGQEGIGTKVFLAAATNPYTIPPTIEAFYEEAAYQGGTA